MLCLNLVFGYFFFGYNPNLNSGEGDSNLGVERGAYQFQPTWLSPCLNLICVGISTRKIKFSFFFQRLWFMLGK